MRKTYLLITLGLLCAFAPGKKTGRVSGNDSFLKKKVSVYIEMDFSKTSIDKLDSEEEFIEFKKNKKDDKESGENWEAAWKKDKVNFMEFYQEFLSQKCKGLPASFNIDDPTSDYKMVLQPIHIDTGTPLKYSSFETKIFFYEVATGKEVAEIYVVPARGAQMGPMAPTTGNRIQMAMAVSATLFAKYYKGMAKK